LVAAVAHVSVRCCLRPSLLGVAITAFSVSASRAA